MIAQWMLSAALALAPLCAQQADADRALAEQRAQIDTIDARLVELLNERARVVQRIGAIKKSAGRSVSDSRREAAVLRNARERSRGPLPNDSIERILQVILIEMSDLQRREQGID